MSARGTILRIATLLAIGVLLGSILGSIVTGDWVYSLVWAIGLPVFLTIAGIVGSRGQKRRLLPVPGRVPGILGSVHPRPVQTQAVLNPESAGIRLNGSPVAPTTEPPIPRPPAGIPWWSRALAILVLLVGLALALLPSYRLLGWTATNLAQGRWDGNDMRSGLHQQEAVDQIAEVVGSYDFASVFFYDSYVVVQAPTSVGATTIDTYQWRYGRAGRDGPYGAAADALFDASRVDFSIIGDLVAAAKADAGWDSYTSFYPSVRAGDDGVPEIFISLGNDYYSAGYTFSIAGELLDRYGDGVD